MCKGGKEIKEYGNEGSTVIIRFLDGTVEAVPAVYGSLQEIKQARIKLREDIAQGDFEKWSEDPASKPKTQGSSIRPFSSPSPTPVPMNEKILLLKAKIQHIQWQMDSIQEHINVFERPLGMDVADKSILYRAVLVLERLEEKILIAQQQYKDLLDQAEKSQPHKNN